MNKQLENEIIIHCQSRFPQEACGFVVEIGGKETWVPCENKDHDPENFFTISPVDFVKASDVGKIKAVVHSHTIHPTAFSDDDRKMQAKMGVPWMLVGLMKGEPEVIWLRESKINTPLYGRTYAWGIHDCYSFIRDYYTDVVGIDIPDFERAERFWERGEDLYRNHFAEAGFVEINDPKDIQLHDVFIISLGGTSIPSHGAIYIGGNAIGHHLPNRLSCKEVYGRFYQSRTVLRLRHKDLT